MLLNFVSGVGEENLEEKMMILYNINENTGKLEVEKAVLRKIT